MKYLFTLTFLLLISIHVKGQRSLLNQKYESLTNDFKISEEQLKIYREEGKLVIFNDVKHKTKLAKKLLDLREGRKKTINHGYYKNHYEVISKQSIPHYRVRYIFINKTKFESPEEFQAYIKKVRKLLGETAFKSVAMQYSMDYKKHVGGDTGWFKEGKTHPEFFKEVSSSSRLAEEVFEFEIPADNAYYFVQKTHASIDIPEVLVLETKDN